MDMSVLQGVGAGVSGLVNAGSSVANTVLGFKNFDAQKEQQAWERSTYLDSVQYQKDMNALQMQREDNAVQRRALDLESAGLSKTLAAGSASQAGNLTSYGANMGGVPPQYQKDLIKASAGADLMNSIADTIAPIYQLQKQKAEADIAKMQAVDLTNTVEAKSADRSFNNGTGYTYTANGYSLPYVGALYDAINSKSSVLYGLRNLGFEASEDDYSPTMGYGSGGKWTSSTYNDGIKIISDDTALKILEKYGLDSARLKNALLGAQYNNVNQSTEESKNRVKNENQLQPEKILNTRAEQRLLDAQTREKLKDLEWMDSLNTSKELQAVTPLINVLLHALH